MRTVSLNGTWKVRAEPLSRKDKSGFRRVKKARAGWIPARVPGEIHLDLMRAGRMPEPLFGTNAAPARWPERKSWWYRTVFKVAPGFLKHEQQALVFDGLDLFAQVFLNGALLGESKNAFIPRAFDVRNKLKPGRNELVVRVTAGNELAPDEGKRPRPKGLYGNRDFPGRKWLRKPQFTYGWDWVDALPNIGIWRGVRLEARSGVGIEDLRADTHLDGRKVLVEARAALNNLHPWSERSCTLEWRITPPSGQVLVKKVAVDVQPGQSPVTAWFRIPDPKLWWPNGMGAQPLYTVAVRTLADGEEQDRREITIGLRTIAVDRTRIRGGTRFCVRVNGRDVFCKGGNWIPADAILARVKEEKYERLIAEARNANINMLRIWGGGIYENPEFYDACDRAGILVWHDFMFACSHYPDHDPAFLAAVREEAETAVRALRHHPCIALWCGNNENTWGFRDWWGANRERTPGSVLYNDLLPEVCRLHDPHRFYWTSSPAGGEGPNDELSGDCHWWGPCTMNPDVNRRIRHEVFDECRARFVSEYGIIGPCHLASIRRYLDPADLHPRSRAWKIHTNTFEKQTLPAALRRHYADPEGLSVPDYVLYGQMFQAMMYGHSLEALRFRKNDPHDDCQGAIIWMYTDCWGETGWTIVDYYLRRKPSYYWFRRACAPVKPIVRRRGRKLVTRIVNDTLDERRAELWHGWVRLDGTDADVRKRRVRIPANGMIERAREPIPPAKSRDPREWLYFARLEGDGIEDAPSLWTAQPFRRLHVAPPDIRVDVKGSTIRLDSPVYCHAVHLDDQGGRILSDNYFDLLPGIPKTVHYSGSAKPANLRFRAVMPRNP